MKKILLYPLLLMALIFCACNNNEDSQHGTTVNADGFNFAGGYWFLDVGYAYEVLRFEDVETCTLLCVFKDEIDYDVYVNDEGYICGLSENDFYNEGYTYLWKIVDTHRFICQVYTVEYTVIDNNTVEVDDSGMELMSGTMYRTKGFAK